VRGAHPTGMSLSGGFYAAQVVASSCHRCSEHTLRVCYREGAFYARSSGKWCAEPTLRVCYREGAFYAAQVVAIGARSAPLLFVGCILCAQ
jgi:hypothetical protein